jgi:hypothetical protein
MNSMSMDEMESILNNAGIKTERVAHKSESFKRKILFSVYGIKYEIAWHINESNLSIGEGYRAATLPFKFIYFDNTYPLVGGNKSIGFAYEQIEQKSIFDRPFRYEVLRIPIEIE